MPDRTVSEELADFESWCRTVGFDPTRDDKDGFRNSYTLMAWRGWAGKAGVELEPWDDGTREREVMVPETLRVELAGLRTMLATDQISMMEFERRTADARLRYERAIAAA